MAGDIIGLTKQRDNTEVTGVGGTTVSKPLGERSSIFFNETIQGVPRNDDLFAVRLLGQTTQIQWLKDIIKHQVASTSFHVKPNIKEEDTEPDERLVKAAEQVEEFLDGNFNRDNQSFDDLVKIILDDVLDFNTGIIEMVGNQQGNLEQLIPRDGLTFTKNEQQNGLLPPPDSDKPAYFQFSIATHAQQYVNGFEDRRGIDVRQLRDELSGVPFTRLFSRETKEFSRNQIAWFSESPVSYNPYGFGRTQKVKNAAEIVLNGDHHRNRFFLDNEFHKGVLSVDSKMSQDDKKALKRRFKDSAGNEHELPIVGSSNSLDYINIDPEPEKMQFLESQKWYSKLVIMAYGLNEAEAGLHENANLSVSEEMKNNIWRRTTNPLLEMIEQRFNNQILPKMQEYKAVDGQLKFEFEPANRFLEKMENEIIDQELDNNTMTLNEARERKGDEPYGEVGEMPLTVFERVAKNNPTWMAEQLTELEDVPEGDGAGENPFENLNINVDNSEEEKSFIDTNKKTVSSKEFSFDIGDFVTWEFGGGESQGEIIERTDEEGDSMSAGGNSFTVEDSSNPLYKIVEWDEEAGENGEFTNRVVKFEEALSETSRPENAPETVESVKQVEDVDLEAPDSVKSAAQEALNAKEEFDDIEDCGTGVGEDRARAIINDELEPEDFLGGENTAIPDYLDSHSEDVEGIDQHPSDWNKETWTDGCGPVQYALWGGTATGTGLEWANETERQLREAMEDEEEQDSASFGKRNSGDGSGSTATTQLQSYREAFKRTDELLEQTKDALRNERGFNDVPGIVNHKEEMKDDIAEVFNSINLEERLKEEFPDEEQENGVLVDADKIVNNLNLKDRLGSVLETNNLTALEMAAEHHEHEIEKQTEDKLAIPEESKIEISFDLFDTFTANLIRQEALSNATDIESTVKNRIKNQILKGAEEGEGIDKITDRIQEVKSSFSKDKAELVARTETLQSSRKGSQALAESTDLVGGKEWIATDDNRTRAWHDAMDGEIVEKDSLFTVPKVSDDQPNDYPRSVRVVGEDQPFNCFDNKTEVLTENGWKLFRNVEKDERVYTFNMETQELELQETTGYIEKEVDEILRYEGESVSIGATPEHDMIVTYGNGPKKRTLGDIKEKNNTFVNIPNETKGLNRETPETYTIEKVNGEHEYQDELYKDEWAKKEINIKDWAAFLGIYLAEGNTVAKPDDYCTRIAATKEEQREKVEELVKRMDYDPRTTNKDVIIVNNKQLALETKDLSKGASNKTIPDYVSKWNKETINEFLDWYTLGDGNITEYGSRRIWTTSEKMADQLQQLFILTGKDASVLKEDRDEMEVLGEKCKAKDLYCVQERKRENKSISQRENDIKEVDYDGKVRCLETPNGTLMVRRNKKAIIAGNCRCSQAPVINEDMPDSVTELSQLSGVTVDLGVTERQYEVWKEHGEQYDSFQKFWSSVTREKSKSELAEKFNMSKTTVYSWSQ